METKKPRPLLPASARNNNQHHAKAITTLSKRMLKINNLLKILPLFLWLLHSPAYAASLLERITQWGNGTSTLNQPASATFRGGVTADNGKTFASSFDSQQKLDVLADLQPAPEHQGKLAHLYLVAKHNNDWYMKNSQGEWRPWDYQLKTLVPHTSERKVLQSLESIIVQKQLSNLTGEFQIFVGYQVDQEIYYNLLPIKFSVIRNDKPAANGPVVATPKNTAPLADAGNYKDVNEGTPVTLDASNSRDPDGSIVSYHWEQIKGTPVNLNNANSAKPSFVAPEVNRAIDLQFKLTVTDNQGAIATSTVDVTVRDVPVVDPQVITDFVPNPVPTCNANQVLTNGVCETSIPVCVGSQVLQGGVCVNPAPVCIAPQVLQNGVCVSVTTPLAKLLSQQFVELRGRSGHQGYFPLFSSPNAGPAKLQIETSLNTQNLSLNILTSSGNTNVTPTKSSVTDSNILWEADPNLPSSAFKLRYTLSNAEGGVTTFDSDTITPRTYSLTLSLVDDHSFSPGDNKANLTITNHSIKEAPFEISLNGSEIYMLNQVFSKTSTIPANTAQSLDIPIRIPKAISSHTLTLTANVKELSSNSTETAKLDVLVVGAPLTLNDAESQLIFNPGNCKPLDRSQSQLTIMLAGTSHLDVNDINLDSVKIIGSQIQPMQIELIDAGTTPNKACSQQQSDGKTDLVITYAMQDILKLNTSNQGIYISVLYFTKNGMRYNHTGILVFP